MPWSGGERGRLLRALPTLEGNPGIRDYVVFAHRPSMIRDRRLNGPATTALKASEKTTGCIRNSPGAGQKFFNGHIHGNFEAQDRQFNVWISGEGLAHLDIVQGRQVARVLVGDVNPGLAVDYHWEALSMPFEFHCNSRLRNDMAKYTGHFEQQLERLEQICGKAKET
ncbi:MAG: hypothetical protein Ct9H300mP16_12240 [Pseudomonadota bacterium]|nr:MAG: hypothetical protein Ct9H300mP16_12240 [Pseudomonadota bacterium]